MFRWTGLAPWEFEFPFPGSLTSTSPPPGPRAPASRKSTPSESQLRQMTYASQRMKDEGFGAHRHRDSTCTTPPCCGYHFTEMCSGSEAGSYLRLIDFVYHSTLGLRVIKKKEEAPATTPPRCAYHVRVLKVVARFPRVCVDF